MFLLFLTGAPGVGLRGADRVSPAVEQETARAESAAGQTRPVRAPDGMELAGPLKWTPATRVATDRRPVEREFRVRHYLTPCLKRVRPDAGGDTDGARFVEAWVDAWVVGATPQDKTRYFDLDARLAGDAGVRDPLVLTLLAVSDVRPAGKIPGLERALAEFESSDYPAFVRFWATSCLISAKGRKTKSLSVLGDEAVALLRRAVLEGELTPEDGVILADRLVDGWGEDFFRLRRDQVCALFAEAGEAHRWTSLVLEGERQIALAWKARGGGYANTVTAEGWAGFKGGLAKAREAFTQAWLLHPDRPLAAARMVRVALGESRPKEMRVWFDRAVEVQFDHENAWTSLRWGLRPRWFGSPEAMLALGIAAVDSGRFDSNVPRQIMDVVNDLERDLKLAKDSHIYGRPDIWPHIRRMYEGYIAAPSQAEWRKGWRSTYLCVAYLAGDHAVARAQLEALEWQPESSNLEGWGFDPTLLPLLVAGHTGTHASAVAEAETAWRGGDAAQMGEIYRGILASSPDAHTRELAEKRLTLAP